MLTNTSYSKKGEIGRHKHTLYSHAATTLLFV